MILKATSVIRFIIGITLFFFCESIMAQGKISRNTHTAKKTESTKFSVSGNQNGHDYVDLGLPSGRLWATNNIGSNSPAGYGDYYSWAETKTKSSYNSDNCHTIDLCFVDGIKGKVQSDTVRAKYRIIGVPSRDAATFNWGSSWELPTAADFAELNRECVWNVKTIDGHKGYLITGPNKNTLFLPMAGYMDGTYKSQVGTSGFYWTGEYWDDYETATMFSFTDSSHNGVIWGKRDKGRSIRPVFRK